MTIHPHHRPGTGTVVLAAPPGRAIRERTMNAIRTEGELCILTASRRLVLGCFTAQQRDLADIIRTAAGVQDTFGIINLGPVRICVEPLEPADARA